MGVGPRSLGVICHADNGWSDLPEHLKYRLNVALGTWLRGENIAGVEAKPQMLDVLHPDTVMGPYQFFLKLPHHTLQFLDIRRILLSSVT